MYFNKMDSIIEHVLYNMVWNLKRGLCLKCQISLYSLGSELSFLQFFGIGILRDLNTAILAKKTPLANERLWSVHQKGTLGVRILWQLLGPFLP